MADHLCWQITTNILFTIHLANYSNDVIIDENLKPSPKNSSTGYGTSDEFCDSKFSTMSRVYFVEICPMKYISAMPKKGNSKQLVGQAEFAQHPLELTFLGTASTAPGRHYPSGADRSEEQRSNLLTLRSSMRCDGLGMSIVPWGSSAVASEGRLGYDLEVSINGGTPSSLDG